MAKGKVAWGRETMAGLAGAIGSVPDGMATAVLAGANPMAGLYASFAGPVAGGALQSTTVMVIATTSAAAVTTAEVMNGGPTDPTRTLATLTLLAGGFMILATALGFARLMRFVSASVMDGFMFGVGLILILGQLADATGVKTSGASTLEKALNTLRQWQSFDVPSMLIAATAIVISVVLGRGKLVALAPLVAIIVPTVVLKFTGTEVATVESNSGPIAVGLPPIVLPDLSLISPTLLAAAAALTIVVLIQAAGVGAAYPNTDGTANDLPRDFYAQGGANLASGLFGGIPVGGSVGQTAFNVMAGGRTRWAVIFSGVWMLVFVVLLGPALSAVPIPALAGLLILAGFGSLRPRALARTWQTSKSSGAAALLTMFATLLVPVHVAVLTGMVLSLLLVGINSAKPVHVAALEPTEPGRWSRGDVPTELVPGQVTVVDIEGADTFVSVPGLFAQLPRPPEAEPGPDVIRRRTAVVLRLRGHLRTNLTFTKALEAYAEELADHGGTVIACGLQPEAIAALRSSGLPESVILIAQGEELDGSLNQAYERATAWLDAAGPPATA
ncbi:MAG: SulP family inorganic anion transporter [Propionicimonas sp.]